MTQQVNLYQPILRREKKVFSAATMAQILALIGVLMLLLFAFNRWQLERLQDEYTRLQSQERALVEEVSSRTRSMQTPPESRELRRQLEAANREIQLKQRLLELMQAQPGSGNPGFSDAFAGLARQGVNGLWLTDIELDRASGGNEVTLRGMTSRAELVPQLVQQLNAEPAFRGLRFRHMHVFQPDDATASTLTFVLSTQQPKESKE